MRILVAYASRHGATKGVAERIARKLEDSGSRISLQQVDAVDDVATFDAAVVGSSVYFGGGRRTRPISSATTSTR